VLIEVQDANNGKPTWVSAQHLWTLATAPGASRVCVIEITVYPRPKKLSMIHVRTPICGNVSLQLLEALAPLVIVNHVAC
jgi:hypothetical protein